MRLIDADKMIADTERMRAIAEAIDIDGIITYINENAVEVATVSRWRRITDEKDISMQEDANATTNRWISIKDRLPDDYGVVLVTWVNRNPEWYYAHIKDTPFVGVAHFYPTTKRWYWYSAVTEDYLSEYGDSEFDRVDKDIDITHWMPLPEPPLVKGAEIL